VSTGMRDLKKEKRWLEIVEKYKVSGKRCSQFCKDEGVNKDQFYYWRSTLAKRQKEKSQTKPLENKNDIPFVPLNLPNNLDFSSWPSNTPEQIEISKVVFRISANTDKSTLACILQSLEKA
jgi:transposase-like protein